MASTTAGVTTSPTTSTPNGPARIFTRPDTLSVKSKNFAASTNLTSTNADRMRNRRNTGWLRPYNGVQPRSETVAVITIYDANGPMFVEGCTPPDGDASGVTEYTDFILQNIEEARAEKQQVVDTFGSPYVFFYGEQPRTVTINGVLLNTDDHNHRSQFWRNYDLYFRGTKLVQNNARIFIAYDTVVLEG